MNKKIIMVSIFAALLMLSMPVISNIQAQPCPAAAIPPGVKDMKYSSDGKGFFLFRYKPVNIIGEEVGYKVYLRFHSEGIVVGIPNVAAIIELTVLERKNRGDWYEVFNEEYSYSKEDLTVPFTRTYDDNALYELRATTKITGELLNGEVVTTGGTSSLILHTFSGDFGFLDFLRLILSG